MSVHKAKLQQGLSARLDRGYKRAFDEGHASRDAEVAKLKDTNARVHMNYSRCQLALTNAEMKLTEAERLNKVALEAMKMHARNEFGSDDAITDTIREIEGALK